MAPRTKKQWFRFYKESKSKYSWDEHNWTNIWAVTFSQIAHYIEISKHPHLMAQEIAGLQTKFEALRDKIDEITVALRNI